MTTAEAGDGWRRFWDGAHSIYVNDRHRDLHYRTIADDLAALVPSADARVLDYGCGEALAADRLLARCGALTLFDTAPSVLQRLRTRFAGRPNLHVVGEEELAALPDGAFDMVILNSVAQYLDGRQMTGLLAVWHRLLRSGGRLVLADIIPPGVGPLRDAAALLRFARRGGFLLAALAGLVRTALSDYRTIRGTLGLTTYTDAEMLALLASNGFDAVRAPTNVGHNPARMTFVATRRHDAPSNVPRA